MDEQCKRIEAWLPAYALDALAADKRWQVDAHVDSCDTCRVLLDEYLEVGLGLLAAVPSIEPPARNRARLIAALAENHRGPSRFPGAIFRRLALGLGGATLVAFMVLTGTLALQVRDLASQQTQLSEQLQEDQTISGLYSYPTAISAIVEGDRAYGTFLYEPNLPISVLYAWGLDPLEQDATYQIWLIEPGGGRISGGLFQVDVDARFVRLLVRAPEVLSSYAGIGVTIEPAGGSTGPTGPKVLGADL